MSIRIQLVDDEMTNNIPVNLDIALGQHIYLGSQELELTLVTGLFSMKAKWYIIQWFTEKNLSCLYFPGVSHQKHLEGGSTTFTLGPKPKGGWQFGP